MLVALALLALVAVVALAVISAMCTESAAICRTLPMQARWQPPREICLGDVRTEAAAIAAGQDYAVNRNDADGAVVTVNMPVTVTVWPPRRLIPTSPA